MDTKEVLHTQGKWKIIGSNSFDNQAFLSVGNMQIATISGTDYEETQANAELICKAVNERQKLLDSNRELLEALEEYLYISGYNYQDSAAYKKAKTAINNAKNNIV